MLFNPELIEIGHTKKTYGISGAVRLTIFDDFLDVYADLPFVFIKIDGLPVPWKVEHYTEERNLCVKFKDIETPEEAQLLTGQPLYAAKQDLPSAAIAIQSDQTKEDWTHFSVFDAADQNVKIGIIKEIQEFPHQIMALVEQSDGTEHYIPMVEEYIVDINVEEKKITFNLPEGLLDLSL